MGTYFNDQLGFRLGEEPNSIVLETRDEHQVAPETIHFAVLATLAEVSAAHAVGASVIPTSINLQLISRAKPGTLIGRGTVLKRGRRLAFAEGEVFQGEKLVAKASVQFAVL